MYKDVIRALETGSLAEIGVIAFMIAFLLIVIYAFTLSKADRDYAKQQPLHDDPAA